MSRFIGENTAFLQCRPEKSAWKVTRETLHGACQRTFAHRGWRRRDAVDAPAGLARAVVNRMSATRSLRHCAGLRTYAAQLAQLAQVRRARASLWSLQPSLDTAPYRD